MKKVALIGSTGSIGRQVIEVVQNHPDLFKITALVANRRSEEFEKQIAALNPAFYAAASEQPQTALCAAEYDGADLIFNAAGGFAGLSYSLAALNAGKNLALANKETLVCGGELALSLAQKTGAQIIPVDSEHSAIWQCLNFNRSAPLRRLIITASGGPFRGVSRQKLKDVTPQTALAHPTWKMGKKITIDSATLMNKGYEIIEAHMLYGTPYSCITAVIQPQSIIHSMVEFADGAILAQMSYPTMELPIQLALTYPERVGAKLRPMDFASPFSIDFSPIPKGAYRLFDLAVDCGKTGGTLPCVLNAADEVAVNAFLNQKIGYLDIERVVEGVVSAAKVQPVCSFEGLKEADTLARANAEKIIKRIIK